MTNCPDDTPLADDVPAADAAEQHQPAADSAEDAGLDLRCVADLLQRDTNPSDMIRSSHHRAIARRRTRHRHRPVLSAGNPVVFAAISRGAVRPGPVEQVRLRGAGGDQCGVIPVLGPVVLGEGHQRISQTQRAHVMRLGGLRDLDKRLVKTAAPQRDEHTFSGVEDPRPRAARILRPARRIHSHSPPAFISAQSHTPYNL
jgi:hypothetical protein